MQEPLPNGTQAPGDVSTLSHTTGHMGCEVREIFYLGKREGLPQIISSSPPTPSACSFSGASEQLCRKVRALLDSFY